MGEPVFFRNLTTKGLTAVNTGERYFEGFLTVQVKDKQGEVTIVDELMKVLPVWIDRGAPISDTHSNRIIGKGINYSKVEYKDKDGEIYPAIKVTGKIHKNYELDNDIWQKIKSGEYKGLSFGGATKSDREPMRMKDGSIAYSLKDLEHYEVAVCRDPAVPLALITEFNTLAKAVVDGEDLGGGRMLIKCDKYGCFVDKVDNNSEAGIKVQEARENAVVYDDKTIDHVNETPLENQTKLQKTTGVKQGHQENCEFCAAGDKDSTIMVKPEDKQRQDSLATHQAHHRDDKNASQDWSNADGDRHGMYNQDTDSGGMGKKHTGPKPCKCGDPKCKDPKCVKKRDSVLQGHGGEQNNAGEVGWSGSGSPYPKNASQEVEDQDEVSAEHKTHNTVVPAQGKETKIVTPDGQIYYIEFPEDDTNPLGGKPGKTGNPSVTEKSEPGLKDVEAKEESKEDKEFDETWHKLNPPEPSAIKDRKRKRGKKKAIVTNILTRLKNLGFMLNKAKEKQRANYNDMTGTDDKPGEFSSSKITGPQSRGDNWMKYYYWNSNEDLAEAPIPTSPATLRNYLKPTDQKYPTPKELHDEKSKKDLKWEKEQEKKAAVTHVHSRLKNIQTRIEISNFLLRKTEEFGDMNTGEVEWTEPRDTANSRVKRGKDVD